jgi:hypothetical protein
MAETLATKALCEGAVNISAAVAGEMQVIAC